MNSFNRAILTVFFESNISTIGLQFIDKFLCLFSSSVRRKRALTYEMLLTCRAKYPGACGSDKCQEKFLADIRQLCSEHSKITLRLQPALIVDELIQFALQFIGFTFVSELKMEIVKLSIMI